MARSTYSSGSWLVICDACGKKFKHHQLTKRWDGLMVCNQDWEPRQPQDFVKGVADTQVPPYTRPEQEDVFGHVCTPLTVQGIADYGTADCAQADFDNNVRPVCTVITSSCIPEFAIAGCMVSGKPHPGMLITI